MNRAGIRRMITESIVIVLISLIVIGGGLYLSSFPKAARAQEEYRSRFAGVLKCNSYELLDSPIIDNYKDIREVYIGYDEEGAPKGYIIDVTCSDEYAQQLHLLVAIDYESATIKGMTHIEDESVPISLASDQFKAIKTSFMGKRIPVAFTGNITDEEETDREEVIINGLHDGIYFAQSITSDSSGYIDYVEIEIVSGRVAHVTWDAVNVDPTTENRAQASLSGAYRISGLNWATQSYNMCHALIEVQDPKLLNMKSDGTTAVVDGVTCDIREFVELSEECIQYAASGYRKTDYYADFDVVLKSLFKGTAESLALLNEDGFIVSPFNKYLTPFEIKNSDGVVIGLKTIKQRAYEINGGDAAEPTAAAPTDNAQATDAAVPSDAVPSPSSPDYIDGAEDGVINPDTQSDNTMTDSIDDLPMSEIASYVDAVPGAGPASRLAVTCVNTCYKFMKDYLNWLV
ncbi:hypothetical protein SAMN02910456_01169 [Ruminococcaceae bacterium YRB3002]|nr:hypothetical protein SAMN02910456_01169 [Ruminococcaceae bacterium YRB3002]